MGNNQYSLLSKYDLLMLVEPHQKARIAKYLHDEYEVEDRLTVDVKTIGDAKKAFKWVLLSLNSLIDDREQLREEIIIRILRPHYLEKLTKILGDER